ncbi:hypothetical protein PIB30_063286 [Stylosanthes scabra]|uniref:DUF295 domain-containing protein n=1 Tax=Stylosanthes scabra TaxID=79078 RepID=A0ABU6XJP9_9FABA|nr:hypothetical protein [Stylosanthes scabra]
MEFHQEKRGHWGELCPDLLNEIARHIPYYDDYVKLRTVSKSWNKALPKFPMHIRGPWLVLPFDDGKIFQIEKKKEDYHLCLPLPQFKNTRLRGSCLGWLISVGIDGELHMFNPVTRSSFGLPPISTFPTVISYQPDVHDQEYTLRERIKADNIYTERKINMQNLYIEKIVISSSPEEDNFMAVAIYGSFPGLAFYRSGDDKWTDFPSMDIPWTLGDSIQDVILHQEKIYAINWGGSLYEFDMRTLSGGIKRVLYRRNILSEDKYLVQDPDGHLLMVVRKVEYYREPKLSKEASFGYKTTGFDVFELEESSIYGYGQWRQKFNLGNYVLILGYNSSIWKYPFPDGEGNCVRDCIYYTDNKVRKQWSKVVGGHDIGIFNFKDGSIRRLFSNSIYICPPPVWLLLA